jgi:DNA-binding transcriptional LysR family regulator
MNQSTPLLRPLIDLDLLRTVVAIADHGNFSAAAAAVLRTPSAVSMQVRRIEGLLGKTLFQRDSRSVALTPEGTQLVEHARRMLALNDDAVARFVAPEVAGPVRIGVPNDVAELFLPDMLRRLAAAHPGIVIEILVDASEHLRREFGQGRLDLGIVARLPDMQEEPGAEVLFAERLVWAMGEGGIAVERDPLPLAVWDETCTWHQACAKGLQAQGRAFRIVVLSAHVAGQRAAALADLAVTPLPVSSLGRGVVEAPARHGLPPLPDDALVMLVRPESAPQVHATAAHLRESFARLPGGRGAQAVAR